MLHKVLFVDDEPSIRLTLPQILRMKGYEVVATGTVAEAFAAMQMDRFDVLIADLNIGQPGDGFTVVSAMRRIQPQAVTLILTGYPAFETALQAIRSQVDDYLVKPADVEVLCDVIEKNLEQHTPTAHITPRKLWLVMRDHRQEILDRWKLELEKSGTSYTGLKLEADLMHYADEMLEEIFEMLERNSQQLSEHGIKMATEQGRLHRDRNASLADLVNEVRVLREVFYRVIQENLLAVNTSYVINDMIAISENLDQQLQKTIEAFEQSSVKM